jgi:hypothetical protein
MSHPDEIKNNLFDQHVRNAFDQFESAPSDKVWMALEKRIGAGKLKTRRFNSTQLAAWAFCILTLTGLLAYFTHTNIEKYNVIVQPQPPVSTPIAAPATMEMDSIHKFKADAPALIKNNLSSFSKPIDLMPLKNANELKSIIPPVDIKPKAMEQALRPQVPAENKVERKVEKRMESNDPIYLDYKDEQHDINNNALYNNDIKGNTDVKENHSHEIHK